MPPMRRWFAERKSTQAARRAQQLILQLAVIAAVDPEAPMSLAILENAIAQGDFEAQ
jgi:hypothetical protein